MRACSFESVHALVSDGFCMSLHVRVCLCVRFRAGAEMSVRVRCQSLASKGAAIAAQDWLNSAEAYQVKAVCASLGKDPVSHGTAREPR